MYGFVESDRDMELSKTWLLNFNKEFGKDGECEVKVYYTDLVRNHGGNVIYGCYARLNRETGIAEVGAEEKSLVQRLHDRLSRRGRKYRPLGYRCGLHGDIMREHKFYIPCKEEVVEAEDAKKQKTYSDEEEEEE